MGNHVGYPTVAVQGFAQDDEVVPEGSLRGHPTVVGSG